MKKRIIDTNIFLISLAVVMILSAGIKDAWAYFTTYARAEGGYTIKLGHDTEIEEEFSNWIKKITIHNKDNSEPVYVRVKAFCGKEYQLVYSDASGKWSKKSDGYWYYSDIVYGGKRTEPLSIKIENVPTDITDPAEFNVVVIYESTPVRYDKNGNPYADWSAKTD